MYWNFGSDDFVLSVWPEAPVDDPLFGVIMATANSLCVAYAPALSEDVAVPESWRLAEAITARDIWSKMAGGNAEQIGPDGLTIPTAPLIWLARDLLRPKTTPLGRLR